MAVSGAASAGAGRIAAGRSWRGDIRAQTRQTLENIGAILRAAGTSLAHAVECLCLLQPHRPPRGQERGG